MMFLAACQSDALPGENSGGAQQMMSRSDSSYINLRIVNGNATMTRAVETATAAENAVYDGILCIFEGADETSATLKTAVVIDQLVNNPGNSTSIDITQRLATDTHAYGSKLFVLALLNTTSNNGIHHQSCMYKTFIFEEDFLSICQTTVQHLFILEIVLNGIFLFIHFYSY